LSELPSTSPRRDTEAVETTSASSWLLSALLLWRLAPSGGIFFMGRRGLCGALLMGRELGPEKLEFREQGWW
jgi:hypothetical protein